MKRVWEIAIILITIGLLILFFLNVNIAGQIDHPAHADGLIIFGFVLGAVETLLIISSVNIIRKWKWIQTLIRKAGEILDKKERKEPNQNP